MSLLALLLIPISLVFGIWLGWTAHRRSMDARFELPLFLQDHN